MRFSLQDVKKSIQRRGGTLAVSLHFLQRDELQGEIARLIAYHESSLGQARKHFSLDDARACVADYRLANCLLATLSHWYVWRQRAWSEVIGHSAATTLPAEISSSVQLRLALYTYVNEQYHGFLDAQRRAEALQAFAERYQLAVGDLEYLRALDSEDEAVLIREMAQPPEPQEVATLYNQWAFEAALFNASQVSLVIDCQAFGRAIPEQEVGVGTGVGAVIKRLCYLARRLGVYYDLAYQATLPGAAPLLTLTLYGPQEVTGTAQHYGIRLARLCRLLLGYAVPKAEAGSNKKSGKATFSGGIVEAGATVHFLQRSYHFPIDAHVLQTLRRGDIYDAQSRSLDAQSRPDAQSRDKDTLHEAQAASGTGIFDSSIEQSFAEAFMALARSQGVDGWQLEREPEPLLLEAGIFIPDFALTRAQNRVYVEILGFWTPAYRERKVQKLLQLRGRDDLLLAIPREAKGAFSAIASSFPIVYYDGQLSATDVLQVLRLHYDDFAERLAHIDVAAIRTRVLSEQVIPERACYKTLQCYRRSELLLASERIVSADIAFLSGLGLYNKKWMTEVQAALLAWMNATQQAPLPNAFAELRNRWQALADCEDAGLEALINTWPTTQIHRSSIFDATLKLVGAEEVESGGEALWVAGEEKKTASEAGTSTISEMIAPAKKQVRERRTTTRKRAESETTQGDLWT